MIKKKDNNSKDINEVEKLKKNKIWINWWKKVRIGQ